MLAAGLGPVPFPRSELEAFVCSSGREVNGPTVSARLCWVVINGHSHSFLSYAAQLAATALNKPDLPVGINPLCLLPRGQMSDYGEEISWDWTKGWKTYGAGAGGPHTQEEQAYTYTSPEMHCPGFLVPLPDKASGCRGKGPRLSMPQAEQPLTQEGGRPGGGTLGSGLLLGPLVAGTS